MTKEFMVILEYGIPNLRRREFTVQGFHNVMEGKEKFVKFCTRLELRKNLSPESPNPKKIAFAEPPILPKRRRGGATARKTSKLARLHKHYCKLHSLNVTHNTAECFEINCQKYAEISPFAPNAAAYKEINASVDSKVNQALQKKVNT